MTRETVPAWALPYAEAGYPVESRGNGYRVPTGSRPTCCGSPMFPNRKVTYSGGGSWYWKCRGGCGRRRYDP